VGFICFSFSYCISFLGNFLFQKAKIFRNLIEKTRSRTHIEINIFMALAFVVFWSWDLNSERVCYRWYMKVLLRMVTSKSQKKKPEYEERSFLCTHSILNHITFLF
jgi:hypothetical protein